MMEVSGVRLVTDGPLTGQFVFSWRTDKMPAPAFWYYKSREDAELHAAKLDKSAKP